MLAAAAPSPAYQAEVVWQPVAGAEGYRIYVGYDSDLLGAGVDAGRPQLADDGALHAVVVGLPVGPTAHFSVAAYNSAGEGGRSERLSLDYATVAEVVDSDGDGMTDAEEDLNLDGTVDPGETDPRIPSGAADSSILWIAAHRGLMRGSMRADNSYAAGRDADPTADALTGAQVRALSSTNAMVGGSGDEARYQIELPHDGFWFLWGRFYYPGAPASNDANSFFARVDGGPLRKLGNNRDRFHQWHWDGDGEIEHGPLLPLALGWLAAGQHELVVEKREVVPYAPRLDLLALTSDVTAVPDDAAAAAALGLAQPSPTPVTTTMPPGCGGDGDCDDGVSCTVDRCDPASGECSYQAFDALCADGVACTLDRCLPESGGCTGMPRDALCDDADSCTVDRCTVVGCEHEMHGGACDDGIACTIGDRCTAGICAGGNACTDGFLCIASSQACEAPPGDPDNDGLEGGDDPCPIDARNACYGPAAFDRSYSRAIRINAHPGVGSCAGARVDCNGEVWVRDFGYLHDGKSLVCDQEGVYGTCVLEGVEELFGCTDHATQEILQCAHLGQWKGQQLDYGFDLPDGRYLVNLMFANLQSDIVAPGARIADITAEGALIYDDFDIIAASGGPNRAVVRAFVVDVADGDGLQLEIARVADRTSLSAIEILMPR